MLHANLIPMQSRRMYAAWTGAFTMLWLLCRTSAAAIIYIPSPAMLLSMLVAIAVVIFLLIAKCPLSTKQAYCTCGVLGAVFTCISFRLTTLF